mmetsp:Transcript_116060/g.231367  ORF Transcript_116060/g.231367 Transcript_116060/m.231367 type:complete len:202 (+) Transcript_116060:1138-1743(+)
MAVGHCLQDLLHRLSGPRLLDIGLPALETHANIFERTTAAKVHDEINRPVILIPLEKAHYMGMINLTQQNDFSFYVFQRHLRTALADNLYNQFFAELSPLHPVATARQPPSDMVGFTERAAAKFFDTLINIPDDTRLLRHKKTSAKKRGPLKRRPPQPGNKEIKKLVKIQTLIAVFVETLEQALHHVTIGNWQAIFLLHRV